MKDSLITLGGNLESPGDSKASDYPAVGPSGPAGMAMGKDKLVKQTVTQEGPQHTEDDGPGKPVPSDRSRVISENFKVSTNGGEAGTKPGEVKPLWPCGVDFEDGQMTTNATMQC
jgi:hypothetical protein